MANENKPTPPPTQVRRQITPEELNIRFDYHTPTPEQIPLYEEVRRRFKELAAFINNESPEGREKNVAFTHLEQAQFSTKSAIARRS